MLKNLLVIRVPNSTNYKIAPEEWQRVHELSRSQTNSQELIKKLLRDHLINLKKTTVLERMGGYSEHLIEGTGDLSDRDTRKKIIAKRIQQKQEKRQL